MPRPTYPIAGEFFLGAMMLSWGLWVLVFPGHLSRISSLSWLWSTGEELVLAVCAVLLGATKITCAYKEWLTGSKIAATLATGLWLQLGVKAYVAIPHVHPAISGIYFCAALCSVAIIWSEEHA